MGLQDYMTLLAQRWQGGAAGRIVHWIVWNEADNSQWFDMSPEVNGESDTVPSPWGRAAV